MLTFLAFGCPTFVTSKYVRPSRARATRAMILSSLDDGANDKSDRSLLELVLLAESRGYKQAEKVCLVQ